MHLLNCQRPISRKDFQANSDFKGFYNEPLITKEQMYHIKLQIQSFLVHVLLKYQAKHKQLILKTRKYSIAFKALHYISVRSP